LAVRKVGRGDRRRLLKLLVRKQRMPWRLRLLKRHKRKNRFQLNGTGGQKVDPERGRIIGRTRQRVLNAGPAGTGPKESPVHEPVRPTSAEVVEVNSGRNKRGKKKHDARAITFLSICRGRSRRCEGKRGAKGREHNKASRERHRGEKKHTRKGRKREGGAAVLLRLEEGGKKAAGASKTQTQSKATRAPKVSKMNLGEGD